jgi:hypothetical protein
LAPGSLRTRTDGPAQLGGAVRFKAL